LESKQEVFHDKPNPKIPCPNTRTNPKCNDGYAMQDKLKIIVKEINLFDVYEGKLGDKKSYALSFIIQDSNKNIDRYPN
jgi:hypothetical protein